MGSTINSAPQLSRKQELVSEWIAAALFGPLILKLACLSGPMKRLAARQLRNKTVFDLFFHILDVIPYTMGAGETGNQWGCGKGSDLSKTNLQGIELTNLPHRFSRADFSGSDLRRANCVNVNFDTAAFDGAKLEGACFENCGFLGSSFTEASAIGARFINCRFQGAHFESADLENAQFLGCNLYGANLQRANLQSSVFQSCRIFGISLWGTKGEPAITASLNTDSGTSGEPVFEVDGLHIAVFLDSLWRGNGIREFVDGMSSTLVLILGRFTPDYNKQVLNSIRSDLRSRGYTAIMYDTSDASSRNDSGIIQILSRLSRFVIADITDPKSTPHELAQYVPFAPIPTQCVIRDQTPFSLEIDNGLYQWVLPTRRYPDTEGMIGDLGSIVANLEECRTRVATQVAALKASRSQESTDPY
jgi:uncharacterized protein YjbI with pentapeptide repeats